MNLYPSFTRYKFVLFWVCATLLLSSGRIYGADGSKRNYNIPSAEAPMAFRQFTVISGYDILFAAEVVRGVRTAAISGDFSPQEALNSMLAGTKLTAVEDSKNRTFSIRLSDGPKMKENDPSRNRKTVEPPSPGNF